MAIRVKKGEPRELPPARSYIAVLIGITDIGTQTGGNYGPNHQIVFTYELHGRRGPVKNAKGDVFTTSQFMPVALGSQKPSKLAKTIAALTGKPVSNDVYDIDESLLDSACRLTLSHVEKGGNTRENVEAVAPLDEDDDDPEIQSDSWFYEIDPAADIPADVPKWLHGMIEKSEEFTGGKKQPAAARHDDSNGSPKKPRRNKPAAAAAAAPPDDEEDDDQPKPRKPRPARAAAAAPAPPPPADDDDDDDDIPF
jgi:hypothetical protein